MLTRRAGFDDLDACADVLAEAFADYPWTRWTVDAENHGERVRGLQRLALERFGQPYGQVWLTEQDSGIACVAVWMDSAIEVPSDADTAAATAELEGTRHPASVAAEELVAAWRPAEQHYYLATIGTRPALQRRGLGARTLAPGLEAADAAHVMAYLETSSAENVAFYARLGFAVTQHAVLADGGPDVWAMTRAPRGVARA